jgi:hypothetical protein
MNLGLPSWNALISEMGSQLDFDPMVFKSHGDVYELAEYYWLKKTALGSPAQLDGPNVAYERGESRRLGGSSSDCRPAVSHHLHTNYDRWLEIAFQRRHKSFVKIANVGDFTKISDGVTQIVKLHGDFEDDSSLVLTETSYFERLAFESPLDIKLRSDSIGRPILFIGYGFSDINIRYLQYKLDRMWSGSAYSAARPKSFMFLARPNPVRETILDRRGILPVVSESDEPSKGLATFLKRLVREAFGGTA